MTVTCEGERITVEKTDTGFAFECEAGKIYILTP